MKCHGDKPTCQRREKCQNACDLRVMMDERTKAIDSAVRNFASVWQSATAAYDAGKAAGQAAGQAAERERWRTQVQHLLDARDRYGWSPEVDAEIEALGQVLGPNV